MLFLRTGMFLTNANANARISTHMLLAHLLRQNIYAAHIGIIRTAKTNLDTKTYSVQPLLEHAASCSVPHAASCLVAHAHAATLSVPPPNLQTGIFAILTSVFQGEYPNLPIQSRTFVSNGVENTIDTPLVSGRHHSLHLTKSTLYEKNMKSGLLTGAMVRLQPTFVPDLERWAQTTLEVSPTSNELVLCVWILKPEEELEISQRERHDLERLLQTRCRIKRYPLTVVWDATTGGLKKKY